MFDEYDVEDAMCWRCRERKAVESDMYCVPCLSAEQFEREVKFEDDYED